ncbi:MAG: glycosyltransferase family 4 protein [Planctomycetes bacterium]|nr:glycosyltransferase family 4 protein [Planctomycetota bacterium]
MLSPTIPSDMPSYRHLDLQIMGRLRSHLWEQISLPLFTRGHFLINLGNTAPAFKKEQAVSIMDLQVWARPSTHSFFFNRVYGFIVPRAVRNARTVLAISNSTSLELEKWFQHPTSETTVTCCSHEHVLRTPSQPDCLAKHNLLADNFLLAVSSLNPNKNFLAILQATKEADIHIPFVIVGGTNPKVFAGQGIDALPKEVIHVGRVSDGELRALYENALGFVYPSFYEGWGLPPGEAMQLGCPVISSHTSSLPEVCGDAALYCDPADVSSLAAQLKRLVNEPALRDELREKGKKQIARFSWRKSAQRAWQAIEACL